jgi:hypothetical protein
VVLDYGFSGSYSLVNSVLVAVLWLLEHIFWVVAGKYTMVAVEYTMVRYGS